MANGFQGPGFFDAQGNWVDGIPGQTLNSNPINTPNSSTGEPAFAEPSATGWSTEFAQPAGGQLTTTPNSRTGAPAPGIRNLPATAPELMPSFQRGSPMPGFGGRVGAGIAGALPFLMNGPSAGQVEETLNNPPDPSLSDAWHWLTGSKAAAAPATQTQPAPNMVRPDAPAVTTRPPPPIDLPPFNVPPPPGNLPPFNRGPIPYSTPQNATAPVAQRHPGAPNLGYGVPQQPAAAPQAPSSMFTTIDRPNADISGGPTRGGWLSASYDPSTGSNRGAREPGGPARMGALDLSGLFSHPAVAQAAAQHPAVQGALAHNIAQSQAAPRARAPVMQQQPGYVYPRQNAPMPSRTPSRGNPFDLFGTVT